MVNLTIKKTIKIIFGVFLISSSLYLFLDYDPNSIFSFVNGLILGQSAVLLLWGFKEIIVSIINSKEKEVGK